MVPVDAPEVAHPSPRRVRMSSAIALTSTAAAVNSLAAVRAFAFLGSSPNLPTSFLTRAAPDDATCAKEAGERNVGRRTP